MSNLTIVVFNGMPIKEMRTTSLTELDLSEKEIGVVGSMVAAGLLRYGLGRADVHPTVLGRHASQLSSAVLGNTKIEVFNEVPIKEMRADSFTELNLEGKDIGVEGGMVVAGLLPVMASLLYAEVQPNLNPARAII